MDKRIQAALAEAPETVRLPEPEEVGRAVYDLIESFIITTKRVAEAPRFDDMIERQLDRKPVSRALAQGMMSRLAAHATALRIERRRVADLTDVKRIPYGANEDERSAEVARIAKLDLAEEIAKLEEELRAQLAIAAAGRHRLKDKRYGSVTWRILGDLERLAYCESFWQELREEYGGFARKKYAKVDIDEMEWDAVQWSDV